MPLKLHDIEGARQVLKGHILETPCVFSTFFSSFAGGRVFLKLETLQATASFKDRGAFVKLKSLSDEACRRGVVAVSAGNHAQAVAYHAHHLGIPALIVMPLNTPATKVRNTEKWGTEVMLHGVHLDDARVLADAIALERGLTFIHPYDDSLVIAGQGTIGLEMLEAQPLLENLIIPIGGGGLAAGIALAAKSLKPSIKIYGVEVASYASMAQKLGFSKNIPGGGPTLAEGIAVKSPGKITSALLKSHLEDIIIVEEAEIERAVDLLARKQKIVSEGAGAAGIAALLHAPSFFKGKNTGIVICGGNIDPRIFSSIIMRGQMREGYITHMRVTVSDVPGTLAQVTQIMAHHRANILELKHQRFFYDTPVKMADVDVIIETCHPHDVESILEALKAIGFQPKILVHQGHQDE